MEDFIAAGINSLAILIAVACFVICIIGILILKDTTDIKKMLKDHFGDNEKKEG